MNFLDGFEKAAYLAKRPYKAMKIEDLDPHNESQLWSAKIDGAHTVVKLDEGKTPRLFSHRISKRTGSPIEYTHKLPHIQNPSPMTAIARGETYAVGPDGRAVDPEVVTAILNSGQVKSLELQKRLGLKTQTALIDLDEVNGEPAAHFPFEMKRRILDRIAKESPDFIRPDEAQTAKKKQSLLGAILSKTHPQTKEGLVVHDLTKPSFPFTKAKVIDHHDVYVRQIFHEEATKEGRKPMAAGFLYSWEPNGPVVGRVGTGFDHAMKTDMMYNPNKYIGRVAKVKALDISKNKVLLKPSFDGWHVEKNLPGVEKVAFFCGFEKESGRRLTKIQRTFVDPVVSRKIEKHRREKRAFFVGFDKKADLKNKVDLQPHQQRVVEKAQKTPGMLLYHGLGSGKTLSAIAATQGMKTDVITPASLRPNFAKEVAKHTKGYHPDIMSYEKSIKKEPGGEALVVDEAHLMGDTTTKRTQSLIKKAPLYQRRFLLTGTPIKNKPHEIGALMRVVRGDKAIPADEAGFREAFIGEESVSPGLWGRIRGVTPGVREVLKDPDRFRKIVQGHVDYHEPSKEHFPSVTHEVVQTEMHPEQIKYYNFVMNKAGPILAYKIRNNLPPNKQEASQLNAFLQGARQVSNTPAAMGGKDISPKFDTAVRRLKEKHDSDPNFRGLVYSNYLDAGVNAYAKRLQQHGISHAVFHGALDDSERKQIVDDYNSGKIKTLLISGAGAQGLDLKGTKLIQIMEPHWNDTRLEQAIGRGIRYKSHEHLPEDERHVHVERYQSTVPKSFWEKITGGKSDTSTDQYLDALSKQKQALNDQFLKILQEEGSKGP